MSNNNEFNLLMEIFERVIAQGHANVTKLRVRADRDLGMHVAMRLVESEIQRNTRRFQLEESLEAVARFNAEIRQKITTHTADFKQLLRTGEAVERIIGGKGDADLEELRTAIRKLQQVSAEFEFVELGMADVQSKIQAMV